MKRQCANCQNPTPLANVNCPYCGSGAVEFVNEYRDDSNRKCVFTTGTMAERSAEMIDAYTRRAVSDSDTLVHLSQDGGYVGLNGQKSDIYGLKVAHISSCGWVDIFRGSLDSREPHLDRSEHMSLTPSEYETLRTAYAAWEREGIRSAFSRLQDAIETLRSRDPHTGFDVDYPLRSSLETLSHALGISEPTPADPTGMRAESV